MGRGLVSGCGMSRPPVVGKGSTNMTPTYSFEDAMADARRLLSRRWNWRKDGDKRRLGGFGERDVDDLVGKVGVVLARKADERGLSPGFVRSVCAYISMEAHRKSRDNQEFQTQDGDIAKMADKVVAQDVWSGADALMAARNDVFSHQYLREALSRVEAKRAHILYLRFIDGASNKDVAEFVGLSEGRVSTLTKEGLEELHKHYVDVMRKASLARGRRSMRKRRGGE